MPDEEVFWKVEGNCVGDTVVCFLGMLEQTGMICARAQKSNRVEHLVLLVLGKIQLVHVTTSGTSRITNALLEEMNHHF